MHPRLVEDHVGHFGQPVLHILDPAVAGDLAGRLGVGLPEGGLVDPVALLEDRLGKAEGVEHLHRAAGDAVGLALLDGAWLALDDTGADVREGGELRGQRQPGGAAADDEDVERRGQRALGIAAARCGIEELRIARAEPVLVILHRQSSLIDMWTY